MKTARKIVSILYAVFSSLISVIFIMSTIYAFSEVEISNNTATIGIIGGADGPTATLITKLLLSSGVILMFLFPLSSIGFNIFNLITAFKNKVSKKLNIGLIVWSLINLIIIWLIPNQSYTVQLYMLYRTITDFTFVYLLRSLLSPAFLLSVTTVLLIVILILSIFKNKTNA